MTARKLDKHCSRCQYWPPIDGRRLCEKCSAYAWRYNEKVKERRRQHRAELLASGICPKCWARPVEQGHNKCRTCIDKTAESKARNKERDRLWRAKKYKRTAAEIRAMHKMRRERLRQQVLAAYGGLCACCGESEQAFLTVDHINNDGAEHRENYRGDFYIWLRRNKFPTDNFQLLCWNCNITKHRLGRCPHGSTLAISA